MYKFSKLVTITTIEYLREVSKIIHFSKINVLFGSFEIFGNFKHRSPLKI